MKSLTDKVSIRGIAPFLVLPILLLLWAPTILGADFWKEKSYREWSEDECHKILQDSPWSKEYRIGSIKIPRASAGRSVPEADRIFLATFPYIKYRIQLSSALPIRQAIARMWQISRNYDDLEPEQRKLLNQKAESFLAQDLSRIVVVSLTYETNDLASYPDITKYWQSKTAGLLKNDVFLYDSRGDRVPLERYIAPQGAERSFHFIFPRQYRGEDILGSGDKSLTLEFTYWPQKVKMEFITDEMRINGKVAY